MSKFMKIAIYAGSFDPPTIGHLWVIIKAARLFDKVIVAVGTNPDKVGKYMFSTEKRIAMLQKAVKKYSNVEVVDLERFFVFDYAKQYGIDFIVRGIRDEDDFKVEHIARNFNEKHNPNADTWFTVPTTELLDVSSSFVKGLVGYYGWENIIKEYLTKPVWDEFMKACQEKYYEQRWMELWQRIGATGNGKKVFDELADRYGQKHRAYHTLAHVSKCLDEFQQVKNMVSNPEVVEMAIWFHDAIYDTKASDNEKQSAELCTDLFRKLMKYSNLSNLFLEEVVYLINVTKHNQPVMSREQALIVDIDLAVLGASVEEYTKYQKQIRKEYGWVKNLKFNVARKQVLNGFLDKPFIYETKYFQDKFENTARINLQREIDSLNTV